MAYKVTSEDGLRILGTRVANHRAVISEEFYNAHAKAYGWEDKVERVNKTELAKASRKSTTRRAEKADVKSDTPGAVEHVGQTADMSDPSQGGDAR